MRLAVLLFATIATDIVAAKQPNILFLMCDSMDGRVMDPSSPVYDRVRMPNLRSLADEGVNFVRTYAASPQCVPSRTTMFTGRHTHNIKAWSNSQGLAQDPSQKTLDSSCETFYDRDQCKSFAEEQNLNATLVDTLEAARCDVCLFGKVDVGAGIIESRGQENSTADGFHNGPTLSITGRSSDIRKATKPDPLQITNDTDNYVHPEDWKMVDKCIEWLESHDPSSSLREKRSESWMLYCSLNIPHPAFQTNATWLEYVNDGAVNVPTWLPRLEFHAADAYMSQSKAVWRNFSDAEILEVRKTYYAMCAETDYLLGRVMDAARRTGHLENTYIVFLSDHGEMNMEHRQVWKNSMYEASSRVPLIISGPGVAKGVVNRNLTSLLDVHPTLLDFVGGSKPSWLDGFSLAPMLVDRNSAHHADLPMIAAAKHADASRSRPDYVVSQYHSNMGNTGSFMLRKGNWKYVAFGTTLSAFAEYKPQLFDVENDPEELNDLLRSKRNDPQIIDVAKELDAILRGVVDYPSVDAEVKRNDAKIYKRWYYDKVDGDTSKLRKMWESVYSGFDNDDWEKVTAWQKEIFGLL